MPWATTEAQMTRLPTTPRLAHARLPLGERRVVQSRHPYGAEPAHKQRVAQAAHRPEQGARGEESGQTAEQQHGDDQEDGAPSQVEPFLPGEGEAEEHEDREYKKARDRLLHLFLPRPVALHHLIEGKSGDEDG